MEKQETIFRQKSVDRVSSPEQLDNYLKDENNEDYVIPPASFLLAVSGLSAVSDNFSNDEFGLVDAEQDVKDLLTAWNFEQKGINIPIIFFIKHHIKLPRVQRLRLSLLIRWERTGVIKCFTATLPHLRIIMIMLLLLLIRCGLGLLKIMVVNRCVICVPCN